MYISYIRTCRLEMVVLVRSMRASIFSCAAARLACLWSSSRCKRVMQLVFSVTRDCSERTCRQADTGVWHECAPPTDGPTV